MLHVDAAELYELPVAGRMLFADPVRLRRWARQGRIPLVRQGDVEALPRAWVDAVTGRTATDAEALRTYWMERLAPAPPEARRPSRDATRLEVEDVLAPEEAAKRLYADPLRLARLVREGTLVPIRVDGATRYDADLVDRMAREGIDADAAEAAQARRAEIHRLARYEYVTDLEAGARIPATETRPAPASAVAVAPRAWRVPDEVAGIAAADEGGEAEEAGNDEPPPLIEADGFAAEDEDP